MAEFREIIKKNSKVQTEILQTIEKKKESFSTQSKIGQKASVQSNVFEQAINIFGDTIENMDIEIEQKNRKNRIFGKWKRITRL